MLQRFLAELTGLPTSRSGRRWLPPRWTEVIETYEQQGRAWQQDLSTHPGEPPRTGTRCPYRHRSRPARTPRPRLTIPRVAAPPGRARAEYAAAAGPAAALAGSPSRRPPWAAGSTTLRVALLLGLLFGVVAPMVLVYACDAGGAVA